jgi:hypothetical protein
MKTESVMAFECFLNLPTAKCAQGTRKDTICKYPARRLQVVVQPCKNPKLHMVLVLLLGFGARNL